MEVVIKCKLKEFCGIKDLYESLQQYFIDEELTIDEQKETLKQEILDLVREDVSYLLENAEWDVIGLEEYIK